MTHMKIVIPSGHMGKRLCSALVVGHKTARAVLYVLKKQTPGSQPHLARVGRQPVTIPKNKVVAVQCSVLSTSQVVLEPNHEALSSGNNKLSFLQKIMVKLK